MSEPSPKRFKSAEPASEDEKPAKVLIPFKEKAAVTEVGLDYQSWKRL